MYVAIWFCAMLQLQCAVKQKIMPVSYMLISVQRVVSIWTSMKYFQIQIEYTCLFLWPCNFMDKKNEQSQRCIEGRTSVSIMPNEMFCETQGKG